MRAKPVNERTNFERGQDPARKMGIGVQGLPDKIVGIGALRHFLHYAQGDFIDKVWGGDWVVDHLKGKLEERVESSGDGYLSAEVLLKFIGDLDGTKQQELYTYIAENHADKW